jgi:hypothetical protein
MAGYSGTPLAQKLGIKAGMTLVVLHAPDDYAALLKPLPKDLSLADKAKPGAAPFVHLFVKTLAELERGLPAARKALRDDGALWISWYKKSAKVPTDVTEDRIRERILTTDLVDVKVCAVSEIWSGLKCVVRKEMRAGR